jgi:NAD(P)H-hydrate repair Nnr-like enzyme with NAD(P)H-hydrate epimerase domain
MLISLGKALLMEAAGSALADAIREQAALAPAAD